MSDTVPESFVFVRQKSLKTTLISYVYALHFAPCRSLEIFETVGILADIDIFVRPRTEYHGRFVFRIRKPIQPALCRRFEIVTSALSQSALLFVLEKLAPKLGFRTKIIDGFLARALYYPLLRGSRRSFYIAGGRPIRIEALVCFVLIIRGISSFR